MISISLNDAVSLLLQLEVTDSGDLKMLRDSLITMAFENQVPAASQPHVARAARLIGNILDGTSKNVTEDFQGVSEALDFALKSTSGETPDRYRSRVLPS